MMWTGPIVDAHLHFWDPSIHRYPWLEPDATIPFRYGDYSAIKRRYLRPDYERDTAGHDVVGTVYMEAEWDPADPIGETRYVSQLAETWWWPNAMVAQAWLDRSDAADLIAAQAGFPLVRSVRHKPGGPSRPGEPGRTLMSDDRWRRGYAELSRHNLHFDLQTPWWNLGEAVDLANDFPETTIVLNHAGLPSDRSREGLDGWRSAVAALADCPNVVVKISGIGLPGRPWTVADNRPIVRDLVAMFGARRAMFASNFPVDSLCADFDTIATGIKTIVADLPFADQEQIFNGTAARTYRLSGAGLAAAPGRQARTAPASLSPS